MSTDELNDLKTNCKAILEIISHSERGVYAELDGSVMHDLRNKVGLSKSYDACKIKACAAQIIGEVIAADWRYCPREIWEWIPKTMDENEHCIDTKMTALDSVRILMKELEKL